VRHAVCPWLFFEKDFANDKSLTIMSIYEYDRFFNAFTQSSFSMILSVAAANHHYV